MRMKLLKLDVVWILKPVLICWVLAVLFFGIVWILSVPDNAILAFVHGMFSLLGMVSLACSLFLTLLLSWMRCRNQIWEEEASLFRTFPVSLSTLFSAKVLAGLIVLLLCLLVSFALPALFRSRIEWLNVMWTSVAALMDSADLSPVLFLGLFGLLLYVELAFWLLCGFAGLAAGHHHIHNRIAWSLLVGILLYFGFSLVMVGLFFVLSLWMPDLQTVLWQDAVPSTHTMMGLFGGFVLVYGLADCILYVLARKWLLEKADVS